MQSIDSTVTMDREKALIQTLDGQRSKTNKINALRMVSQ
jgi:hypothetical protein